MTNFDENSMCAITRDRLDAFVDDDLSAAEATAVTSHVATCCDCADELAAARSLQENLRGLPKLRCPDRVVDRVLEEADVQPANVHRFPLRPLRWMGALAAAVLLVVAASVWRAPVPTPSDVDVAVAYTPEEVALAKHQVEQTFVYLAKVSQKSLSTVGKSVIEDKIIVPVGNSLMKNLTSRINFPEFPGLRGEEQ